MKKDGAIYRCSGDKQKLDKVLCLLCTGEITNLVMIVYATLSGWFIHSQHVLGRTKTRTSVRGLHKYQIYSVHEGSTEK